MPWALNGHLQTLQSGRCGRGRGWGRLELLLKAGACSQWRSAGSSEAGGGGFAVNSVKAALTPDYLRHFPGAACQLPEGYRNRPGAVGGAGLPRMAGRPRRPRGPRVTLPACVPRAPTGAAV